MRLPLLADQPYTDEGIYAATSYFDFLAYTGALAAPGWVLPQYGHLSLYALFTSWVYALPVEPLLMLRLIDAAVAAMAAVVVFRFLRAAAGHPGAAFAGALALVLAMNHPLFINAGYKNPIMVALAFLAAALLKLTTARQPRACLAAGALVAGAVLFREFFLPMAAVTALYAAHRFGRRGLLLFGGAGGVAVAAVVGLDVALRGPGGLDGMLQAYAAFTGDAAAPQLRSTWTQALLASKVLLPLLPLFLVGLATPIFNASRRLPRHTAIYCLGLGLTLAPAPEIAFKAAFPYHFSQGVFGMSILIALGGRALMDWTAARPGVARYLAQACVAAAVAVPTLLLSLEHLRQYRWQATLALRFYAVTVRGDWTSAVAEQSLFLHTAQFVRQHSVPGATMLTDPGAIGLFALTRRLPSAVGMGSLGNVVGDPHPSERARKQASLIADPPDVLVLARPPAANGNGAAAFAHSMTTRYAHQTDQPLGLSPYGGRLYSVFTK